MNINKLADNLYDALLDESLDTAKDGIPFFTDKIIELKNKIENENFEDDEEKEKLYEKLLLFKEYIFAIKVFLERRHQKYIMSEEEIKNDEFNNNLNFMNSFSISAHRSTNLHLDIKCIIKDDYVWIYGKNCGEFLLKRIIFKEHFVESLKELYIGEWKEVYNTIENDTVTVSTGDFTWDITIDYVDSNIKRKKFEGDNKEPFSFDEVVSYFRYISNENFCDNDIDNALLIALDAHKGQVDKAGVEYILHPLFVSSLVNDTNSKVVAILHDVLEDSDYTLEDLKKYNFNQDIIDALLLVTKTANQDYNEYLENIKLNEIARIVKLADLTHNSDTSRLTNVTDKDIKRREKYLKAIDYLSVLTKEEFINKLKKYNYNKKDILFEYDMHLSACKNNVAIPESIYRNKEHSIQYSLTREHFNLIETAKAYNVNKVWYKCRFIAEKI
ncbi:MAG: hypothetical protein R3Y60_04790, partial [bacterium]